ncbi:MFS transporter [Fructilactobacillus carniphilus]|uniref:MFS transporter n=1 Tax=Fructilactobacillus carniphilus TaxID=2940297 RepID=A0ABY5BZT0_9LACO|nr:MFS transporter [Fructilactobacillus carniphilus]USS90586.1 MFS transporter [Fructilactobacillus carniphilus]
MTYLPVLRNAAFRWLITGNTLSNIASSIANVSLVWIAYHHFNSPLIIAVVLGALELPSLLIGPFAGGLLDHFQKTTLMTVANLINALVFIFLIFNPLRNPVDLGLFLVLLIISGAVKPLLMGGSSMIIQEVFPTSDLKVTANSLNTMSFDFTYLLGALLSGLVLSLGYGLKVYGLVAGLYLVVSFCYSRIKVNQTQIQQQPNLSYVSDLKNALRIIFTNHAIAAALILDFVWNLFLWAGLTVLLPIAVKLLYGNSAIQYGFLDSMTSVGIILGSLLVGLYHRKQLPLLKIVAGAIALHAVLFILIGFSTQVYVTAFLLFLIGLIVAPALIYKSTFYQSMFNSESKGLLFTLAGTMTSASYPIGIALTSLLASLVGSQIGSLFIGFGGVTLVTAGFVYYKLRRGSALQSK